MPSLYLTPASISYLNQLLLSLVIAIYLCWRFFPRKHQPSLKQDLLLAAFFVFTTIFSLALFLDASLLPTERLLIVYSENTILGLMLIVLIQFAYNFPTQKETQKIERRLALVITIAYTLFETVFALWRYSMLQQGQVEFRQDYMDYAYVLEFLWVVFVFTRGAIQNWHIPTSRYFPFIFLILFYLAALNLLRTFYFVSAPFYHNNLSIGILVTIFLLAINYLASKPETTFLMTKISGVTLTSVLAVLGVVAWSVTPIYVTHYTPTIIDHRTLHFAPNTQGGYNVTEIPFNFDNDIGQNLGLTDSPIQSSTSITNFNFPFYGKVYKEIYISDNGSITFGQPLNYKDLEYGFSKLPAIFAGLLDLYPEISTEGGVFLRRTPENLIITFYHLKSYFHQENTYTSQLILHTDGSFEITSNGLPSSQVYYANDRPDAALWAIGAKPALASSSVISFINLPLQSGSGAIIQDEHRTFRQFLHEFLLPLAEATFFSSLFFLLGIPLVTTYFLTQPLNSLLKGVKQINKGKRELHIPVQFNDEVGFLTQSFNEMTHELNSLITNLEVRVTERTADLVTANEQLQKLSIAVEQSPSSIVITDLQAQIQYVNSAFTTSTGYTLIEVLNKNPRILKSDLTSPQVYREMWEALSAGKIWRGELINRRKDGENFYEYTVIAPIHDENNVMTHYVAIKEDITARKKMEQLREDMTNMLVHDLRNPLGGIQMSLEYLADEPAGTPPDEHEVLIKTAQHSAENMSNLVNAFLDIVSLENGKMPVERVSIKLSGFVSDVLQTQEPLATKQKLLLKNDVPLPLPSVLADPKLIWRVIQNLVGNAIKFTPEGGTISVTAAQEADGFIRISVSDTGRGIATNIREKLFQKFTVGNVKGHGTGLGLAFCKLAVETHDGKIWAESEEGKGTTIHFTLPLD